MLSLTQKNIQTENSSLLARYYSAQEVVPELSVIMPVYNGAHSIVKAVLHLRRVLNHISRNYELIVINDGSIDDTAQVVKGLCWKDPRIKFLSYEFNMGKGYAIKQGVSLSKGKNIMFIDGDSDINPAVIARYLEVLEHADLVVASKYHPHSTVKAPLLRRILSIGFQRLVKLTLGIKVRDTQAGLKVGRSQAFKQIFTKVLVKRYAFDVEMLTVSTLLGHKIVEMPIDIDLKKQFRVKEMIRMFVDLTAIAYRLRILKWYQKNLDNDKPHYTPLLSFGRAI